MKKFYCLFSLLFFYTASGQNGYGYITEDVTIREKPLYVTNTLSFLLKNEKIFVDSLGQKWSKISSNNQTKGYILTKTITFSKPQSKNVPTDFVKTFKGQIDNKYDIQMKISSENGILTGEYFYEKIGEKIKIEGNINNNGVVKINEFDKKGKRTGIFEGHLLNEKIEGTWRKLTSHNILTFYLIDSNALNESQISNKTIEKTKQKKSKSNKNEIIEKISGQNKYGYLKENVPIKEKPYHQSNTLQRLGENEKIFVDSLGEEWSKIFTRDEISGYIPSAKITFSNSQAEHQKENLNREDTEDNSTIFTFILIGVGIIILLIANNKRKKNKSIEQQISKTKQDILNSEKMLEEKEEMSSKLYNKFYHSLTDKFGKEIMDKWTIDKKPFIGMPDYFVELTLGRPEKKTESVSPEAKWENWYYDFIKTYRNKDQYKIEVILKNNLVESYSYN